MTLEKFADTHQLPQRWLDLRRECENLVKRSEFWYRPELKDEARRLATQASDILSAIGKRSSQQKEGRKTHVS